MTFFSETQCSVIGLELMLERNTYTDESHEHAQCDEKSDVSTSGDRDQHSGDYRHQDAHTEHVLAAVARRQPATHHLCE